MPRASLAQCVLVWFCSSCALYRFSPALPKNKKVLWCLWCRSGAGRNGVRGVVLTQLFRPVPCLVLVPAFSSRLVGPHRPVPLPVCFFFTPHNRCKPMLIETFTRRPVPGPGGPRNSDQRGAAKIVTKWGPQIGRSSRVKNVDFKAKTAAPHWTLLGPFFLLQSGQARM